MARARGRARTGARNYAEYWPPYVPAEERRFRAAQELLSMKRAGHEVSPIEVAGRTIATTFWGEAWCKNLEAYSDYSTRLPRGRTYVRNGSVLDLQIEPGRVRTLVSGSQLYRVEIEIRPLHKKVWTEIKERCAGQISSLVELLQGSISRGVMEIVTRQDNGLFPKPSEISLTCSCPDWATMCKHVAATLYGVGARLDQEPELLSSLRGVDPTELVEAAVDRPVGSGRAGRGKVLESSELSSIFGVDIDLEEMLQGDEAPPPDGAGTERRRTAKARKPAAPRTKRKPSRTAKATASAAVRPARKAARSMPEEASGAEPSTKKSPGRKRATKKPPARKPVARKRIVKKLTIPKSTTRKATRKRAAKKAVARKSTARKVASRKAPARKTKARK